MAKKTLGPLALIIMDGLGLNPSERGNAVLRANTPVLDSLLKSQPHTTLITYGSRVGLPDGQMGNSEVGHLNIGGGRIVQQELTKINQSITDGTLASIPALERCVSDVKKTTDAAIHFIGLVSTGGVHSELGHLKALITAVLERSAPLVFVHAITDGRDRPPTASIDELGELVQFIAECNQKFPTARVEIASIIGRYFAMDRDKRWERTESGYELFTAGKGEPFDMPLAAIAAQHSAGVTDEFLPPLAYTSPNRSNAKQISRLPWLRDGDALILFNFRADRMRQITNAFLGDETGFTGFTRKQKPKLCHVLSLTEYDVRLPTEVLFPPLAVKNHLGEVISQAGLKQFRIAETEKYPHVTYFFNGGVEAPCVGEERLTIQSPKDVATYDLKPEMSAEGVCQALCEAIGRDSADVYIVNFANCDMVGHTGSFDATVKAVEVVDGCVGRVLECIKKKNGCAIVTADHGNADQMIDYETNGPHTFHTMYPVPLILVGCGNDLELRSDGALCDIAPTICQLLGIHTPAEMTGESLIEG